MKCDACSATIDQGEERRHGGRTLCEDCYMDALSPARTCDPWATYTASRLTDQQLSTAQEAIMVLITKHRQVTYEQMLQATGLGSKDLLREIAALRHMELIGARLAPDGSKVFMAFSDRD